MIEELYNKKILIVEDNPVNHKVMSKLVKIFGHEPFVIEDGFQVMEHIANNRPDLILMDIQLIGISGIEITHKIKTDDNLKMIPVIVVTASATPDERHKIITESLCDDYLPKPFMPNELANKMAHFIAVKSI